MWTAQGLLSWLGIVISKAEASLSLLAVLDSAKEMEDMAWMVKEDETVEQFLKVAFFVWSCCFLSCFF